MHRHAGAVSVIRQRQAGKGMPVRVLKVKPRVFKVRPRPRAVGPTTAFTRYEIIARCIFKDVLRLRNRKFPGSWYRAYDLIRYCAFFYYQRDKPLVPDSEFDAICHYIEANYSKACAMCPEFKKIPRSAWRSASVPQLVVDGSVVAELEKLLTFK